MTAGLGLPQARTRSCQQRVPPPLVLQEQRETDATADSLRKRVAAAEAKAARAVEEMEMTASLFEELHDRYRELAGDYYR